MRTDSATQYPLSEGTRGNSYMLWTNQQAVAPSLCFTIYFYGIKMFLVKVFQLKIPYSQQKEGYKNTTKLTQLMFSQSMSQVNM